ncbi:MAG TPA: hypothetical protein VGM90_27815 [Kofleriaceae bacterium]
MLRFFTSIALALAVITPAVIATTPAYAQAPSAADMAKAKTAFGAGKKAFDAGDFTEAAKKFKESYTLSKNAKLLYNVALANESNGDEDIALSYYRKYLKEAPADDAQRPDAEAKVKALEVKLGISASGTATPPGPTPPGPTEDTGPKKPVQISSTPPVHKQVECKPAGTYKAEDFKHVVVDSAPPKKPLDVTAFVPEDSCFTVTLYYRTAGEAKFTAKEMRWRYSELVGRIPPAKMIGDAVHYYLEVKDSTGNALARSGKSTSPNLVELQPGAAMHMYPDWSDDPNAGAANTTAGTSGGTTTAPTLTSEQTAATDTEEDPLNKTTKPKVVAQRPIEEDPGAGIGGPEVQGPQGQGVTDVGSSKFKYAKWTATGVAVVGLGLGIVMYVSASNYASALQDDYKSCGQPPCRQYWSANDSYAKDLDSTGRSRQTLSRVLLPIGVAGAVVGTYFWYKELSSKKHGERQAPVASGVSSLRLAPTLPVGSEGFTGAAASLNF